MILCGQGAVFYRLGIQSPALAIENDVGMAQVNGLHDVVDCVHIQKAHQVKPEAVDVVFVRPIADRVHDVLVNHGPFGGGVIAAAGTVGEHTIGDTAEIIGNQTVEAEGIRMVDVVIDHVHNDTDAVVVEALDHLLHFLHTDFAVESISGIGTLGDVEVYGIVTPVELGLLRMAFVHRAKIVNRQKMQMGDAQLFDVVQACGDAGGGFGSRLHHAQEFALVLDTGAFVHGKVPDMKLIDDGICESNSGVGVAVPLPAGRIGGGQVNDHGPLAVDTGGSGIGVAGFGGIAIHGNGKGIINAMKVAFLFSNPGALFSGSHGDLFDQVVSIRITAFIQVQGDLLGGGCPKTEAGAVFRPDSTQIGAMIGIGGFKLGGRKNVCHQGSAPCHVV